MKKIVRIALIVSLFFLGCTSSSNHSLQITHLDSDDVLQEVKETLENQELKNAEIWIDWVKDFNQSMPKEANLSSTWINLEENQVDIFSCMDGWENTHADSDADCRMSAFLLVKDVISIEKVDQDYDGTHLMFDIDAISTAPQFQILKDKQNEFTTLFKELIASKQESKDAFAKHWQEAGITMNRDGVSLMSVLMFDPYEACVIVGHAGVLIQRENDYLFVEKLAFEQPYQATIVEKPEDLMNLFSVREDYFLAGEAGPWLYQNDQCLGTIKKQYD